MRFLFLLLSLFCFQSAKSQTFEYPKLTVQGNTIAKLIPNNWMAIDTIYGDLNNDRLEDLVLVLEFKDAIHEVRAYGDSDTEIIKEFQKPRILAIYFKNAQHQYVFALQNNNFILRAKEGGVYGDPYQGISIANNTLNLNFVGGSNWRWKLDYHFKYQRHDWILVAAKNRYYHNTSGELDEKNYDFITKKVSATSGNFKEDNANQTVVEELHFTQLKTFSTFKKPWTWEIMKDNFL